MFQKIYAKDKKKLCCSTNLRNRYKKINKMKWWEVFRDRFFRKIFLGDFFWKRKKISLKNCSFPKRITIKLLTMRIPSEVFLTFWLSINKFPQIWVQPNSWVILFRLPVFQTLGSSFQTPIRFGLLEDIPIFLYCFQS